MGDVRSKIGFLTLKQRELLYELGFISLTSLIMILGLTLQTYLQMERTRCRIFLADWRASQVELAWYGLSVQRFIRRLLQVVVLVQGELQRQRRC